MALRRAPALAPLSRRRPAPAVRAAATAAGLALLACAPGARAAFTVAFNAAPSFTATLAGNDQVVAYTIPLTVTDTRGSGAGWNLTITSTQLTTGGGAPATLPTAASSVTGVSSTCKQAPCVAPGNSVAFPLTIPAGATAPPAVKLYNAAVGTGTGTFTTTAAARVAIPANAYAGAYTSTLTIAIVTGP